MRVLLVVPPFGGIERPSLGVHTLQSFARANNHIVDIFYSNISFAAHIGEIPYMVITEWGPGSLLGERIMGQPLGASIPEHMIAALNGRIAHAASIRGCDYGAVTLALLREAVAAWLDNVSAVVQRAPYDIIGFSTTFEQTNGVAVLARRCRSLLPQVRLVAGGANCEDVMAAAIKRYIPELDVIFSGESEIAFTRYLDAPEHFGDRHIINSAPNSILDNMPPLDYTEFFQQLDFLLPDSNLRKAGDLQIPYESSRGCWWGQKHHCTFCGLNGNGIGYREKSPAIVRTEISTLADSTGIRRITMTDNIMPFSFFGTLIPQLAKIEPPLDIFYEQKANISLDKVIALKSAGVNRIQPGIEALNDDLLRLMKKGTSGKQNIALLRYARSVGINVAWNLLSGFPNEREEWYAETLGWVPLISHLQPPTGVSALSFDRFSPYFMDPAQYGIGNVTPFSAYRDAFPACDGLHDLAYHFVGESNGLKLEKNETLQALETAVTHWRQQWHEIQQGKSRPCLEVVEIDAYNYLLIDTRAIPGTLFMQQISAEQASVALSFHKNGGAATDWGLKRSICIKIGEGYMPLACAAPSVMQRFERVREPDLKDAPV